MGDGATHDEGLPAPPAPWDKLIEELRSFRESVGTPSYRELAERVAAARVKRGMDPYAARVGKSTVYDCFLLGRARMNLQLAREVAHVMGASEEQVEAWIRACHQPIPSELELVVPEPEVVPEPTVRQSLVLMLICLGVNMVGREFVDYFNFPIYLDMVGTAIAAIALGPWRGATVGLSTNVLGIIGSGWVSLPFALVNIVGALMWGYGVRRWRMGRTLVRFFLLNVLTAIACSLVAVPIIVSFLEPSLRVGDDVITQLVRESVDTFLVAVSFANILTSTADKLLSGFVALVVLSDLSPTFHKWFPLATALRDASGD